MKTKQNKPEADSPEKIPNHFKENNLKELNYYRHPDWVWNARWESFWLYDKEFFEYTKEDYFTKARLLSESGINVVITFGAFHFRWNFIDEWPRLLEILRWTCEACHKYGIKVVEHHSANLVSAPLGEEEWELIQEHTSNCFSTQLSEARRVDLKKHPALLKKLKNGDSIYKGIRLSSMFQVDPRTGLFSRSPWRGWVLCHNNPDYQTFYFDHLKEIYACGVDGIMTDDIGLYPRGYGCGCICCREKFMNDCGLEMPPSGLDDKNFYGNFDNPAYQSWILWRIACYREHEERVQTHFRKQGLSLARPIYHSSSTNAYGTWGLGASLDSLDGLYSTVFTEVNNSDLQAHAFLRIGAESSHRSALARRNKVPPMCLFYPKNANESLFCWAATKLWGQNYWGTSHSENPEHEAMMKHVCNFEKLHPDIYEKPVPIAEIGIVFSARTVILHKDDDTEERGGMSDPASTDCWAGWCEALTLAGIPYITIVEQDIDENKIPDNIKVLIVPNIVCMKDDSIENIQRYVRRGGHLIITHQSGMKDETGVLRETYPFEDLVGAECTGKAQIVSEWKKTNGRQDGLNNIKHDSWINIFKLRKAEQLYAASGKDGETYPLLFRNKFGLGEVMTFAAKPGRLICINRHVRFEKEGRKYVKIDFAMDENIRDLMLETIRNLYQDPEFVVDGLPEGVICGLFKTESATVIHLLNATGTLRDNGKNLPMPPPINFPDLPVGSKLGINIKGHFHSAEILSPEQDTVKLRYYSTEKGTTLEIPLNLLKSYSVIRTC